MEIKEVRTSGTVRRDVVLDKMKGVTFGLPYSRSDRVAQPFLVQVEWRLPLLGGQEKPRSVEVFGHRVLKSGELGHQMSRSYYGHDKDLPDWVASAVEISRPALAELAVQ